MVSNFRFIVTFTRCSNWVYDYVGVYFFELVIKGRKKLYNGKKVEHKTIKAYFTQRMGIPQTNFKDPLVVIKSTKYTKALQFYTV